MAVKLKKCKECGKMFAPKGRENYCSDIHYRPCPVCGEPAEVLYFSDPPRRCDKCRGKKKVVDSKPVKKLIQLPTSQTEDKSTKPATARAEEIVDLAEISAMRKPSPEIQRLIDANYPVMDTDKDELIGFEHIWTYVGVPTKKGFIPGHMYTIKLTNDRAAYIVTSSEDITANESVNIYDRFSSAISLNRNFVKSQPSNKQS